MHAAGTDFEPRLSTMTLASRRIDPGAYSSPPDLSTGHDGPVVPNSRQVVLVVEDDTLLRMHAAEMIHEAGFEVIEAQNADEAMTALEGRSNIAVVFTDIDMPGSMNGLKLAHAVATRWPPIGIVATSGHFQMRDGDLPDGGRFLAKPYRSHQLLATLRELTAA
jgi:CheY-like chemotaxis protein